MKRKLATLLITVMAVSAMAGCGNTASGGGDGENKAGENRTGSFVKDEDDDGFKPLKEKVKVTIGKNENSSDSYEDGDTTGDNYVPKMVRGAAEH